MYKYIAIVGTIAAGKTTICNFLKKQGFEHLKLSQAIYDEADKKGLDRKNRIVLQNLGDDLRRKHGVDVLAKKIILKVKDQNNKKKYVFDSIRNHHEIIALKKAFDENLFIIAVDAPIKIRYKRAVERQGQYNEQNYDFQEFKKINERDLGKDNKKNEQNVSKCIEFADISIQNTGTRKELEDQVLSIIQ